MQSYKTSKNMNFIFASLKKTQKTSAAVLASVIVLHDNSLHICAYLFWWTVKMQWITLYLLRELLWKAATWCNFIPTREKCRNVMRLFKTILMMKKEPVLIALALTRWLKIIDLIFSIAYLQTAALPSWIITTSLKNLKKHAFHFFCKLKKPQKTCISFLPTYQLKKLQKTWISFVVSSKNQQKYEFHFCKLKNLKNHEFHFLQA